MFRQLLLLCTITTLAAVVQSLKLEHVKEGSCIPVEPAKNVDSNWLSSAVFPYLSGGSRYHLYRIAASHPRFDKMRDFEFYYESCLQTHMNVSGGMATAYGFGDGVIGNYLVRKEARNVIDFIQVPTPGMDDVSRHTITLTDNKSFVVFANCWMGSDQRGWDVVTTTPSLDEKTQKLIEEHIMELGFDREHFVFLRYETCGGSPVPGSVGVDHRRGRMSTADLFRQKHAKKN